MVSDSPEIVDFAVRIVNPVLNLPDRQVKFFGEFKLQKNCNKFLRLVSVIHMELLFYSLNIVFLDHITERLFGTVTLTFKAVDEILYPFK